MSQRHNENKKRPKLQDILLGILKIYDFAGKLSRRPPVQKRALLALCSVCLWEYT